MNAVAEALGLSLPGCAAIPAPYRERGQMAYETGRRIVEMAYEDLRPSRDPDPRGVSSTPSRWSAPSAARPMRSRTSSPWPAMPASSSSPRTGPAHGYDLPLLVNMQPAGKYLGERFHRAGGVPAVMWELLQAGRLHGDCLTVTGRTHGREPRRAARARDREVIRPIDAAAARERRLPGAAAAICSTSRIMKTSVISARVPRALSRAPGREGVFEARAVVFDGADDYHAPHQRSGARHRRGLHPGHPRLRARIGWPGSAEVVNMQPPDALIRRGITSLPTLGDGRQSGTSDSPSILQRLARKRGRRRPVLAAHRRPHPHRPRHRPLRCAGRCRRNRAARGAKRRRRSRPARRPGKSCTATKTGQLVEGATLDFAAQVSADLGEELPRHNH